ncbi:hypothetical protein [Oceanobacillus bengalensis]|uniref:M50 family peptidase n=1 Tax=Oceanobacillus bengalensis TaxID=1435466 RepID=A0A494YSD0_9BACI|nr:hypothetical protein [Oceanobacillus bengalensis]RKQ12763.1 hypothetical protein D8M05_17900 [Oceanobacillus bengalensis]
MEKVKKKKGLVNRVGKLILFLLFIVIGFFGGYYGMDTIEQLGIVPQNLELTIGYIMLLLIIVVVLYVFQIFIHEGGHYVFGRLTGYTFVSFRVGSIMLVRENGRIKRKSYRVEGTLGQCLLMPPDVKGESFPFVLYNLGGVIANIISSLLSIILLIILPEHEWISIILGINIALGIFIALVNGVPMKLGVPNDGMVINYLKKDKQVRKAFWLQLHINGLLAKGKRIRDLPEEWFEIPENADLSNPLISVIKFFLCEYFMDKKDFEKAKAVCQYIEANIPDLLDLYKKELSCYQLFLEIIGDCRIERINEIYTKELKQYIKVTKKYISRIRLLYAYELLVNQNRDAADKQLDAFEKAAKKYPVLTEIESEREMLELIDSIYFNRKGQTDVMS